MASKIISLYLNETTIKKIDELAIAFNNNRSEFINWLARFDFFIEKGKLVQIKQLVENKAKLRKLMEKKTHD